MGARGFSQAVQRLCAPGSVQPAHVSVSVNVPSSAGVKPSTTT